jgi:hypothetical protein
MEAVDGGAIFRGLQEVEDNPVLHQVRSTSESRLTGSRVVNDVSLLAEATWQPFSGAMI